MSRLILVKLLLILSSICYVSSEETAKDKDCKSDGVLYKNGEKWTTKCMKHKCKFGIIQSSFNKSCCHVEEVGIYKDGEAWSNGCWINYCKEGFVDTHLDVTCCINGNNSYKNGEFWNKSELLYICVYGIERLAADYKENVGLQLPLVPEMGSNDLKLNRRKKRAPFVPCTEHSEEEVDVRTWNQKCYHRKCSGRHATWEVDKDCCEFDGVAYPDDVAWSWKCTLYFCDTGTIREEDDENCCKYKGDWFPHGHKWDTEDDDCHNKKCVAGTIKRTIKYSCCEDDGVIYADGEYWYASNPRWVCRDGEIEKILYTDQICTFDRKLYKSGEIWTRGCITYSCNGSLIYQTSDPACIETAGKDCDYMIGKMPGEIKVADECRDGEMKTADDGCNICNCINGHWGCTTMACNNIIPECRVDEMKTADDGCNICNCINGHWGCTTMACNDIIPDLVTNTQ